MTVGAGVGLPAPYVGLLVGVAVGTADGGQLGIGVGSPMANVGALVGATVGTLVGAEVGLPRE